MISIINAIEITKNTFLHLFKVDYLDKKNNLRKWEFVSRKKDPFQNNNIDAVMIVPFIDDKIVFIKQFRVPANNYVYEFPAGLVENEEGLFTACKRELKEETGLEVKCLHIDASQSGGLYNSIGLSDEKIRILFVEAEGTPSNKDNEDSEDIEIIVATREEVSNILNNNSEYCFSTKCWLILKSFSCGHNWIK